MDEHTIYKLARSGQIPSLNPALSLTIKTRKVNCSSKTNYTEKYFGVIERAGAGQWRFKKEVIDAWIREQSLKRVLKNRKSSHTISSDKTKVM